MTQKTQWIGQEGDAFERVSLAFQALGFAPPRQDIDASGQPLDGAYAANIVAQYTADMREAEAYAVIGWGLSSSKGYLTHIAPDLYELQDIVRSPEPEW